MHQAPPAWSCRSELAQDPMPARPRCCGDVRRAPRHMKESKQCKGHGFLGLAVKVDIAELLHLEGCSCLRYRLEQHGISRSAAGDEHFRHRLRNETTVRVRDALGGQMDRRSD